MPACLVSVPSVVSVELESCADPEHFLRGGGGGGGPNSQKGSDGKFQHGKINNQVDISLLHLTIRSSHRCVWCGFEPCSGHM